MMDASSLTWLAADYHLPATYSCRVPMSSITSALALPAPRLLIVRLALIRAGIETFGLEYVQSVLFPPICAMSIHIRPPARVALTTQVLRAYKGKEPRPDALVSKRSLPGARFLEECGGKQRAARGDLFGSVGSCMLKPPGDGFHKHGGHEVWHKFI